MRKGLVLCIAVLLAGAASAQAHPPDRTRTNATYYNDAALPAADPYVLHDKRSGYYYAYSTDGADPGYYFGVYRSADLATWEKVPGGALPVDDPKQWGNDWFWAPEVYFNPRTRLYFMFYAARSDANKKNWFGYADFEEPSKTGVAVSRSPAGPFHNIADRPIDYNPYDPDYHDVNLIMGPDQKKPPATLAEGETAPLGTYIPFIDPDVFFDDTGHTYLYFSRNAYRNWVWDTDLGKYIEESNIYAVELTNRWWNDPSGQTMPSIAPAYRGANDGPGGPPARAATAGCGSSTTTTTSRRGRTPTSTTTRSPAARRRTAAGRRARARSSATTAPAAQGRLLPDLLGQQLGDAPIRRRIRDLGQPARAVPQVTDEPDPQPERPDRDVLHGHGSFASSPDGRSSTTSITGARRPRSPSAGSTPSAPSSARRPAIRAACRA